MYMYRTHTPTSTHRRTPTPRHVYIYSDNRSILFINPTTERLILRIESPRPRVLPDFASVAHFFARPRGLEITTHRTLGGPGGSSKSGFYTHIVKGLASSIIMYINIALYLFICFFVVVIVAIRTRYFIKRPVSRVILLCSFFSLPIPTESNQPCNLHLVVNNIIYTSYR